jgi:hypothetical protein
MPLLVPHAIENHNTMIINKKNGPAWPFNQTYQILTGTFMPTCSRPEHALTDGSAPVAGVTG